MKINLIIIISLLALISQSPIYAGNNKKYELPPKVETFLNIHFTKNEIKESKYDPKDRVCKVKYTNGYKVEFDKNGDWIEIGTGYQPLPKSVIDLLPRKALLYISQNYPRKVILKITRKSYGYKINLLEAPDLLFDKNGLFLEKD